MLHIIDMYSEFRLFAGKSIHKIVFRERYGNCYVIARLVAFKLVFKPRDKAL